MKKPIRVIVAAANRTPGKFIIMGVRHCDLIMHGTYKRYYPKTQMRKLMIKSSEQGFVDQYGEFYSREEAYEIVQKSGQPFNAKRNVSTEELFSEGLY